MNITIERLAHCLWTGFAFGLWQLDIFAALFMIGVLLLVVNIAQEAKE